MRIILLFLNIAVAVNLIHGSFVNPYPKFKSFSDGGDPGEALYLTKYIENGEVEKARNLALVNHPEMTIINYAGYFTVNKEYNSNMFFWFFPAKVNTDNAPVVLWLQGGPGASSLFGLFTENGPYSISSNDESNLQQNTFRGLFKLFAKNGPSGSKPKLIPRKYSWHLNHNLIYIDNPVGTGFSFTDADDGYAKNEKDVGENLLRALQQFFLLFPNLQKNEFFVSGESYAGKYVPAIGYAIYQDSKREDNEPQKPKINLKGLAIGNGLTDPIHQFNYGDYLYQLGLIDSNGHEQFLQYQNQGIDCIKNRDFDCAFDVFDKLLNADQYPQGSLFKNLTGFNMYFNYLKTDDNSGNAMGDFLQKTETRHSIHVGNNTFHGLEGENKVEDHLKRDVMNSVADWVAELLSHYPILVYNGQLDIIVAYPLTENYLKNLNFSGAEEYKTAKRYIWRVDNELAGYVKHAGNLTEVLVRNAGHMAPGDQPKWVLDMLLRFTHHKGFQ
ncbi:venom serine carboxypeptidase-like [Contarinia nasturtii]|uniref:venom serine carboxypeptidase-like n=1 Tax=Contarinia nasturtii TaxID=265458 RepID=UPI0012D3AC23|nr:venom serine carboxypeptidase-like [Contarinia nasturtii]